ncbi:putative transport membrane protein [Corynebacterium diphtheriae]|nr:putative transport membrane protein [Corynebacterium diphtheriae]
MSTASWGWTLHGDGKTIAPGAVVAPEERLSWSRTIGIGMQHVIAMFGATLLVPTPHWISCQHHLAILRN